MLWEQDAMTSAASRQVSGRVKPPSPDAERREFADDLLD
jgi:hypothetical protein